MAIVDEEHSVATAGMVATLLQTSRVMTMGDESQLKMSVDVGLTQGGPASPALTIRQPTSLSDECSMHSRS